MLVAALATTSCGGGDDGGGGDGSADRSPDLSQSFVTAYTEYTSSVGGVNSEVDDAGCSLSASDGGDQTYSCTVEYILFGSQRDSLDYDVSLGDDGCWTASSSDGYDSGPGVASFPGWSEVHRPCL